MLGGRGVVCDAGGEGQRLGGELTPCLTGVGGVLAFSYLIFLLTGQCLSLRDKKPLV